MIIQIALFATLLGSTSLFGASSEIPLKREFPLNDQINPCENLYEHACSKTIESFKLRADRKKHTFAFNDSSERILEFKKNYLKDLISKDQPLNEKDSGVASQIKNFYISCMDKDSRAKEETSEIQKLIEEQKKIHTKKDWFKAQALKIHSGKNGIIGYSTSDNFDDSRRSDLMLGVGYSYLPEKSYAKNPELIKALTVLITDYFTTIGKDHPKQRAQVVIKYELDQQDNRFFPVEARIAYSQRRFISKKILLKKFANLELKSFLDQVPENTLIRNMNPKTLPFLSKIAKTYSLEDLKTIQLFYELKGKLDQGYPLYYDEAFMFTNKFLGGKNKRSELDEECTSLTMHNFGAEFDYLVLPKMFPNFSSEKVAELVAKIKTSILASLAKNTWLSAAAKKEAERKISTSFMRLVSPQSFEEWKFLPIAEYGKNTYLANIDKRNDISDDREFKYFSELKDIRSWEGVEPLEVNAFYQPSYNQFTMLQGILQYPFYDQKNSDIENLAGVGMVVGHELGHAIDDQGSKYDADGKLRNWMSDNDLKKFKELTRSLIDQYSKAGMNGEYTLGENIGDLVGLTSAYDAAFLDTNLIPEDQLKKLKKKFFLNYARSWCEVQLPGVRELRLKSDPHSLGVARVNEVVKHFAAFKEAFDCKDTDPLILKDDQRVHIW
ncbi:MAG: M13 family metallopeptidase [Bacteriovorax sp.]|nr:M13 family metallopeptidase [Bacteriovorax sp.]